MSIVQKIKEVSARAIEELYQVTIAPEDVLVNQTKPEFEGNYTVVLFSLIKQLKRSPEQLGQEIGSRLVAENGDLFTGHNVIKGFLNLEVTDDYFIGFLKKNYSSAKIEKGTPANKKVVVEYSSPNTNKPLHLGHLRNNFLGWSVAEILKASGNEVKKNLYCQ